MNTMNQPTPSRRRFLSTSSTAAAGALAAQLVVPRAVRAAGSDHVKVGLVGCGGRGTGAAQQALTADKGAQLTSVADLFPDALEKGLENVRKSHEKQVKVTPEACFTGFDAYKQLIDSGVDVVLLCSPPGFRPAHLAYAVEKGKHVFTEKPMAVDIPGVHSVLATMARAREANVSIVAGFCYRYSYPERELFKRVHDGEIGKISTVYGVYNTGSLWNKPRKPEWSDMEWQIRNWLYFTWLSGDHIVEQAVHTIDKMIWAMKDEPPMKAMAHGGRQSRTDAAYGHIFDHFSVVYEWADGTRGYHFCRQQEGTAGDTSDQIVGTKGVADIVPFRSQTIRTAEGKWKYEGDNPNMYQVEHNELFAAIRADKRIDDGKRMMTSTAMAIMGRMAAYTGQVIYWDESMRKQAGAGSKAPCLMDSKEKLGPEKLGMGAFDVPPVAVPGRTKFL